jgi:uncharacterized membrane protein YgcG
MITAATVITVGNTMIVAGVMLAVVLLLRAARKGAPRPEPRLGGGISGFDRRHAPRVPEPPAPRSASRARRGRGSDEPTTVHGTATAAAAGWASSGPVEEPHTTWDDSGGGEGWGDGGSSGSDGSGSAGSSDGGGSSSSG